MPFCDDLLDFEPIAPAGAHAVIRFSVTSGQREALRELLGRALDDDHDTVTLAAIGRALSALEEAPP